MSFTVLPKKGLSRAQVEALLVDPFDYDETVPFFVTTAASNLGMNNLVLIEAPRRLTALPVGHIDVVIGTTGGNIDVGVWLFDGTTWTLRTSSGSTAAAAGGTKQSIALGETVIREPGGRWYYGIVMNNGTVTVQRAAGTNVAGVTFDDYRAVMKANSFPIASTSASFTTADTLSGPVILPWLRGKA